MGWREFNPSGLGEGLGPGSCEHGINLRVPFMAFLDKLLKKDSAPWSWLVGWLVS
jgi:hypothetical protein